MEQEIPFVPGLPAPIHGETRIYAILGDPIAQVGSPGLFNPAFRRRGAHAVLVPFHVPPAELQGVIAGLRLIKNFDGIVITVPHKIPAMDLVDAVGSAGRRIGAINAIRKTPDGRLIGDNFDGKGCVRGLHDAGYRLGGKSVLVAGAGGAGRAVAHAVADEKPSRIHVFDPDRGRLGGLLEDLGAAHPDLDCGIGATDPTGFDVVVNCTPLGMKPTDPLPFAADRLAASTLVVDVILRPADSPLIAAARARGCPVQPGHCMLDGQIDAICEFFEIGTIA